MNAIEKLTEIFKDFPGIGPRQAKRFVFHLLTKDEKYLDDISQFIQDIKKEVEICENCFRFFQKRNGEKICPICNDNFREKETLMIVSRDVDFENIEKTKSFNGYYFILGGTIGILEKNPEKKIREKELFLILDKKIKGGLKEIIFALDYNPEGENTIDYLKNKLKDICQKNKIKISVLGKGLSTGTELEYSDKDTIKNALMNRQ